MKRVLALSFACALSALAFSQNFTVGNLVVSRVGDGNVWSSGTAAPVFLVEYTLSGTLVQTVPLPTDVSGSNRRLTNSITATSEGALQRTIDNRWLTLAGYDAAPGTASVAGTTSAAVNRVVGFVNNAKQIDTTTALTDAYSGNNPRSAFSTDGEKVWLGGTGSTGPGVRFTTKGSTTSVQLNTVPPTNTRVVVIANGQLFVSSASGANIGVNQVGTGLPETTDQTVTLLPGFTSGSSGSTSPYDFYFADANTLYVADDTSLTNGGGIQKWTFASGQWSRAYVLQNGITTGVRGLAGVTVAGVTTLYAITGENPTRLVTVTDNGASSPFEAIASAPTNTSFRGVDFAPVPAGGGTTEVRPDSYTVTRGVELGSNDVTKLQSNDDVYAVVQQRFQFAPTLANAELQAVLNVPSGDPITAAVLTVRIKSNSLPFGDASCRQEIALRDWNTNSFVAVDSRKPENPSQGEPEITVTLTEEQRARFINSNGRVEVATRVFHLAPLFTAWTKSVDEIVLAVTR